ncbi:MAG: hypothetical protein RBT55_17630, partial [Rhodocyclaceae bacterium]|nr:hypothetical protein [Rhodocyclaceae bacterium]
MTVSVPAPGAHAGHRKLAKTHAPVRALRRRGCAAIVRLARHLTRSLTGSPQGMHRKSLPIGIQNLKEIRT